MHATVATTDVVWFKTSFKMCKSEIRKKWGHGAGRWLSISSLRWDCYRQSHKDIRHKKWVGTALVDKRKEATKHPPPRDTSLTPRLLGGGIW